MKQSLIFLYLAAFIVLPVQAQAAADTSAAKKIANAGTDPTAEQILFGSRLGRVTAYWAGEDYYTNRFMSATGVTLHEGHCAVDPRIIPYGSVVDVLGVGKFLAVDTGSAVVNRKAARKAAHTSEERKALVVDLFFKSREAGEAFAASAPNYAFVSWETPLLSSTLSSASVIASYSTLLRLGMPLQPLRSLDEIASFSSLLRLGAPADPLRSQVEHATRITRLSLRRIKSKASTRTASHHPFRRHVKKFA